MNLGFPEMFFIFLLALLIFGPKKLPEIARQIGKALAEFKRASNEFQSQLQAEIRKLEHEENEKNVIGPVTTADSIQNQPQFSQSARAAAAEVHQLESEGCETTAVSLEDPHAPTTREGTARNPRNGVTIPGDHA